MTFLHDMLRESFMMLALGSSILIGTACSFMGLLVILRRIIFVSVALAQFSSLGLAIAAYFQGDYLTCSLVCTVVGVIVVTPRGASRTLPPDAMVAAGFAFAWAASILVLSKAAHGDAELLTLMKGNILGATAHDLSTLAMVIGPILLIHVFFFKEFLYVSFDPDTARTQGMAVRFWSFLFTLTLGITIAYSMKLAGVLLTFAYFLFPPAASLLVTRTIRANLALSVIVSLLSSFAGVVISFVWDLPTGPAIVAVLSGFFALSWCWSALRNWIVRDERGQAALKE
jgi:ABC-type Mn2+/Zn2+ transport system permease subunit